ncbi:hypothetical protein FHX15_002078 [Rhizobium sp. BK650]|nr:hypothetical protein [Rhizobium sp. BK650]
MPCGTPSGLSVYRGRAGDRLAAAFGRRKNAYIRGLPYFSAARACPSASCKKMLP